MNFRLETENGAPLSNPSPADIEAALTHDRDRGGFVILGSDDCRFIQAAGDCAPFALEFRDGEDAPLLAAAEPVSAAQALAAFVGFLRNSPGWTTSFTWQEVDL